MTEQGVTKAKSPLSPRDWFVLGVIVVIGGAFIGAMLGAATGSAPALAVLGTIPGSLMMTIGVIAKAVQVGIRSTQG